MFVITIESAVHSVANLPNRVKLCRFPQDISVLKSRTDKGISSFTKRSMSSKNLKKREDITDIVTLGTYLEFDDLKI